MEKGKIKCRSCDMSMGLGSSSLTMVELARAYTAFGTYGNLIEPYYIERVLDRDGTVIEEHKATEPNQVLNPSVAYITHWLLTQVATGGTAARSNRLKLSLAGKTGTTNDEIDAWFVGYNPDIIAAAWVGYDQPRPMGVSFTGGSTALPIWMDYMAAAVPKDDPQKNRRFPPKSDISWVKIDETTGMKALDGVSMPMLPGTGPTNVAGVVGQKTSEDLLINDY
jgi:penicillin-binding protein 1A